MTRRLSATEMVEAVYQGEDPAKVIDMVEGLLDLGIGPDDVDTAMNTYQMVKNTLPIAKHIARREKIIFNRKRRWNRLNKDLQPAPAGAYYSMGRP